MGEVVEDQTVKHNPHAVTKAAQFITEAIKRIADQHDKDVEDVLESRPGGDPQREFELKNANDLIKIGWETLLSQADLRFGKGTVDYVLNQQGRSRTDM